MQPPLSRNSASAAFEEGPLQHLNLRLPQTNKDQAEYPPTEKSN